MAKVQQKNFPKKPRPRNLILPVLLLAIVVVIFFSHFFTGSARP